MSAIKIVFILGFLVESDRIPSKINFNNNKKNRLASAFAWLWTCIWMTSGMVEARDSNFSRMVSAYFLVLALLSL